MIDLKGKHVVVVGGSRGIGAAAAKLAGETGAAVSIIYRAREDAANAVVEAISLGGSPASAFRADASVEAEISAAIKGAVEAHGPIHGLVVSAGVFEGIPLQDMTVEFWDRVMGVNLRATFLAVREAAPHMPEDSSIVIYSSTAGQRGSAVFSAYATSKGAQILFMRSMAQELGPRKIRVNCIAPSWTDTDMADASLTKLDRTEVAKSFALGRIGQADDVAKATLFLLSPLAGFITGTTVTVDGGSDMRG